jgi:hypothetical protein
MIHYIKINVGKFGLKYCLKAMNSMNPVLAAWYAGQA